MGSKVQNRTSIRGCAELFNNGVLKRRVRQSLFDILTSSKNEMYFLAA